MRVHVLSESIAPDDPVQTAPLKWKVTEGRLV